MLKLLQDKPIIGVAGVAGLGFLAWLAFGFFGIQAAFIDNTVEDGGVGSAVELSQAELNEIFNSVEFDDAMNEAAENQTTVDQPEPEMDGEISIEQIGDFTGVNSYDFLGQALVLADGTGRRVLRLEEFSGQNGPDLKVYLRAANGDFVSLGDLQGNIGNQNYEIPEDVDLSVFSTVDIWCERFSVGFGLAPLTTA